MTEQPVVLDGHSLSIDGLLKIANGAHVQLDEAQLVKVRKAADFLAEQVKKEEPIYGVTTGFGSNANRLLGAHHARKENDTGKTLTEELQDNLITTHAVCVGEPFAPEVVRAMMGIRINTLMRGHSGIREQTLQALVDMHNSGIVPVIPQLGSVGASGDLAPLSHLAIVLLGGGEAFVDGERVTGAKALEMKGLKPVTLSYKEGLALNNGTAQMLATGILSLDRLEDIANTADIAAAMTLEAFAGRTGAFAEEVHALRPHPGQVETAKHIRQLIEGSELCDIPYQLVPRFADWMPDSWDDAQRHLTFDIRWDWIPSTQRHGREKFYTRFKPFLGGKKHQPQDSYSLRCIPQVHGAVRDALAQARRVLEIELNSLTDNPIVFPDADKQHVEDKVISAGHFHGMPLALAMSYVKAAIPVLASISERRLNKLVDSNTSDGLPAFLIGNEDATESGHMIVQYTAAAIVNDLASRSHPASVYSIPTSANAEDHVSMGANEARHVLSMADDLGKVIALELYVAAQALDVRKKMIQAAIDFATSGDATKLASKIALGKPDTTSETYGEFLKEVEALRDELASMKDIKASPAIEAAHAKIREYIPYMDRDRALDQEVAKAIELEKNGAILSAVKKAVIG